MLRRERRVERQFLRGAGKFSGKVHWKLAVESWDLEVIFDAVEGSFEFECRVIDFVESTSNLSLSPEISR